MGTGAQTLAACKLIVIVGEFDLFLTIVRLNLMILLCRRIKNCACQIPVTERVLVRRAIFLSGG